LSDTRSEGLSGFETSAGFKVYLTKLICKCIHASQSAHICQKIHYVTKYPNHLTSSASLKGSEQNLNKWLVLTQTMYN